MRTILVGLGPLLLISGCAHSRFADLGACSTIARNQSWGGNLQQIPSTVIDKGVLRDVPYSSLRSGDYEVNVYGDPADPSCVEVGVYRELVKSDEAKRNCLEYMKVVLRLPADRAVVQALNLEKDAQRREGLTFEVSPETAEDSYGGWWVSVYDEKKLDRSRASRAELEAVSEAKAPDVPPPVTTATPAPVTARTWSRSDLSLSRPSSSSSSGGRVYVRGYFRKNGTYVRPHTRSRGRR